MNKQIMVGVVGLLAVLIGGYFLLMRPQTQIANPTGEPEVIQEPSATQSSTMGTVELTVTSKGLKFEPTELRVKEGDTVRVTYKNTMGTHNFVIDEFNIKTNLIDAGQEETVEFVADQKGEFEFYCGVPGHRAAGMKGMLIVE